MTTSPLLHDNPELDEPKALHMTMAGLFEELEIHTGWMREIYGRYQEAGRQRPQAEPAKWWKIKTPHRAAIGAAKTTWTAIYP